MTHRTSSSCWTSRARSSKTGPSDRLRGCARPHRHARRRDLRDAHGGRRHRVDRQVRDEGGGRGWLHRSPAARKPAGRRRSIRLPAASRGRLPQGRQPSADAGPSATTPTTSPRWSRRPTMFRPIPLAGGHLLHGRQARGGRAGVGRHPLARDRLFGARSPFACSRSAWASMRRPTPTRSRARGAPDRARPRDAMAGRSVAGCRLRHGRCRRPGRRAGAPGRVLHVHGRADPVAIRDPDPDAATTGPEHPDDTGRSGHRGRPRYPADAGSMPMAKYRVRCRRPARTGWRRPRRPDRHIGERRRTRQRRRYTCEASPSVPRGRSRTAATVTATPIGRPPAPSKPTAVPSTARVRLEVAMPADAP